MCTTIRETRFAGSWYTAHAADLRREVQEWVPAEASVAHGSTLALIGPHAGLRFSGAVAGQGYGALTSKAYSRLFLLGPSHYRYFEGIALPHPDLTGYKTPLGTIPIHRDGVEALRGRPGYDGPAEVHDREHSLELHTPFIAHIFGTTPMIPLVVGQLGSDTQARSLAADLRQVLTDGDLLIISSDFTHYGAAFSYQPFQSDVPENLKRLADAAINPILAGDLSGFTHHIAETGDTVCGREPIRLMLATLPQGSSGSLLQFDTSGNITGDYDHSVSYASLVLGHTGGWSATKQS